MAKTKLAKVATERIIPNRWRDFELHPLDEKLVERIQNSIEQHQFWGGLCGRVTEGGSVEQCFGHHRIEACRRLGIKEIELTLGAYTDDELLLMMSDENATHQNSSAAVIEIVAAAQKRMAMALLSSDRLDTIVASSPRVAETFENNQHAFEVSRGLVLKGQGVGWRNVEAYLGKSWSRRAIEEAAAFLKQSGLLAKVIQDAVESSKGTVVDLEAARQKKKEEAEALTKIGDNAKAAAAQDEAERLERRRKAIEGAGEETKKQNPQKFDPACAQLFSTNSQLTAYRTSVTAIDVRQVLPVESQFPFGRMMMDTLGKFVGDKDKVSTRAINEYVRANFRKVLAEKRESEEEVEERTAEEQLKRVCNHVCQVAKSLIKDLARAKMITDRHPELKASETTHRLGVALMGLSPYLTEYGEGLRNRKETETERESRIFKEDCTDAEYEDITPKDNIRFIR